MTFDVAALAALADEAARESSPASAAAHIVDGVSAALGAPCAIVCKRVNIWRVEAAAPRNAPPLSVDDPAAGRVRLHAAPGTERYLLVAGYAGQEAASLGPAGAVLSHALDLVTLRAEDATRRARERRLYRFACQLLLEKDAPRLHRAIVENAARCVGAETGALALYRRREDALSIVATYGYPSVLVDHVRIRPGEGIIGRVFLARRPVCARVGPGALRQRRYRGDSYMAVPLLAVDGVLGVVCVTDPADDRLFTRGDLATLREYAVPAALALSRETLRDQTMDLAHLATVDAVTGIFNRRHFDDRLDAEIQRGRREGGSLALLMIDVDDFKALNDTRGHLYGDRVLREVGDILRRSVRSFDVCARYGGEEFVILMPGASASTAVQIAERIRRYTEAHFADSWRFAGSGRPTLSIGVSTLGPDMMGEALIASADAALLWAKAAGKNTVKLDERSGAR